MILAISLKSELGVDVDLSKVLEMLTIHELEELSIGDVTPLDNIDKKELKAKSREFVFDLVKDLKLCHELMSLTDEFNKNVSKESRFAKAVDKLECVLEFKKYQNKGQVSTAHATKKMLENKILKAYVDEGKDIADIFFLYHMPAYEEFGIDEKYWYEHLKNLKF